MGSCYMGKSKLLKFLRYKITITASDGTNKVSQDVIIIVKALNRPPVLDITEKTVIVSEGEKITLSAKATDPDNDDVTITYTGWPGNT